MKNIIKYAISILLICVLIYKADWHKISLLIKSSDLFYLSIVLVIRIINFPLSAFKWSKCLEVHELHYSFRFLLKILCIGFFFNNFLPTSIGGDVYRILKTLPENGSKSRAVSALLIERIFGFIILLLLGLIGCALVIFHSDSKVIKLYLLIGLSAIPFLIILSLFHFFGISKYLLEKISKFKKLRVIFDNLNYLVKNKKKLANIILLSLIFQLLAITGFFAIFKTIGVNVNFSDCAVIAAISGIAAVLPISINGIGVVEGSFAYAATQVNIALDQAITAAFMSRFLILLFSLICGIIYLFESKKTQSKAPLELYKQ